MSAQHNKPLYLFGANIAEGDESMRNLLGGKGANLAQMSRLNLPVPPGFTITTDICSEYYTNGKTLPDYVKGEIKKAVKILEDNTGKQFDGGNNPLLFSVRSGARVSMPGMMDTILNLGLNDDTVKKLATATNNKRFAYDSYRRFLQMFANVVLGVDHDEFEDILDIYKNNANVSADTDLTADDLQKIVADYQQLIINETGNPFPQSPWEQLWLAINAVFDSWMIPRAKTYRMLNNISEDWGTAVNVQIMVFGNMGDDCATGVAFTRDPATGENFFYGEYLINAQGEDVVAGIRTPQSLTTQAAKAQNSTLPAMEETMPDIFTQLCDVRQILETHYKDMQDIEFTVEQGKLYMLQTRNGKRTVQSALRIACDMVDEGIITKEQAIMRIDAKNLDQLLHPRLDPNATRDIIATGLPASPGAASGMICLTADEAEEKAKLGHKVILVRTETSPEDIHGMHAAQGILTARGGMTSHAAVVARGMGRPCVSGASSLRIDMAESKVFVGDNTLNKGDIITIDGGEGQVILGEIPTINPDLSDDFARLMGWVDEIRQIKVRTNAETAEDCRAARSFGAEGIGLCRTEHMFFEQDRIASMRAMIMAEDSEQRRHALNKIKPMQQQDFEEIFNIMQGFPVTIRLLDPPLHEFLPQGDKEIAELAQSMGIKTQHIRTRLSQLHESNPMLGHRGCRLLNSYPEICEMQIEAIISAAINVKKSTGNAPLCEIMVPLVALTQELTRLRQIIEDTAQRVMSEHNTTVDYQIGTMIELPRAALQANKIAEQADFFSFGTNDLTQTAFGISRDDADGFLKYYYQYDIISQDPFATLDQDGVGELITIARDRGRACKADLKLGICGEHGGDPDSVAFCVKNNLDYVSCSPYRVPIARLAAAQATIDS